MEVNKQKRKKIIVGAATVTSVTAIALSALALSNMITNSNKERILDNIANCRLISSGYGDFGKNTEFSDAEKVVLNNQTFTFLSMENDSVSTEAIEKAIAEKKDIGLIVRPTNYTYASIYETIDEIKSLISKYDINCPILYDVTKYMDIDTIDANCKLAEEFCNKLTANGCYVGLYGDKETMDKFSSRFVKTIDSHSLDLYDKMIVLDTDLYQPVDEETLQMGNMFRFSNGVVLWKHELSKIIEDNGLNEKDKFVEDFVYNVESGDSLYYIADAYDISIANIKEYNDLHGDIIYPGDEIVIPNNYNNSKALEASDSDDYVESDSTYSFEEREKRRDSGQFGRIVTGIDVSSWQGDINWEEVSSQIDYAILRLCDFECVDENGNVQLDSKFLQNMEACERLNIPVGVYYFSRATNSEEARKEAEFVADQLTDYTLEYPVYLDSEIPEQRDMMFNRPDEFREFVSASLGYLQSRGYYTGIYTGVTDSVNIMDLSNSQSFWLTSHETYDTEVEIDKFNEDNYNLVYTPDSKVNAYQYCQRGSIRGIGGEIDVDYATIELSRDIEQGGYSKAKTR